MAVSSEQLAAVKQYMRVETSDEDVIISALYESAVEYLRNAGVCEPAAESDLYNLAVWSLTLYYYDHRSDVGAEAGFPAGLRPIINQLKLMATVTEGATVSE